MSIPLLTLLEESVMVRPWLENQLVGPHLLEVVRDLTALGAQPPSGESVECLAERRPELLSRGLAALNDGEIQALFRNPSLLLRLQEWVLVEGGPYWDGVLSGSAGVAPPDSATAPVTLPLSPLQRARRRSLITHAAAVVAGAAAAVLLWLAIGPRTPSLPPDKTAALSPSTPADAVLPAVAEQLDRRWASVRRHPDAAAIRKLNELCESLASADFSQLTPSAQAALRDDLARLSRALDSQRRALEQGSDSWQVRAEVDSLVNSLLVRRWRDPEDLPDAGRDPDDLPGAAGG